MFNMNDKEKKKNNQSDHQQIAKQEKSVNYYRLDTGLD